MYPCLVVKQLVAKVGALSRLRLPSGHQGNQPPMEDRQMTFLSMLADFLSSLFSFDMEFRNVRGRDAYIVPTGRCTDCSGDLDNGL